MLHPTDIGRLTNVALRYGSLQHNTEPHIQASKLEDQLFAPLIETEPELQSLVELISINGHVIEQSYRRSDLPEDEIRQLEAKIGDLCWQRKVPLQPGSGSYRSNYELVAHIHMMWFAQPVLEVESQILTAILVVV